jgi:protein-S-isoprenylcysteine O-methyltransferase Ste14
MDAASTFSLKREFELRIFVSLGIVALICIASALTGQGEASSIERLGIVAGLRPETSRCACFLLLAAHMIFVSVLRMWAGTELSARRVMAFRVQVDEFHTCGPYRLVRNPIYLADFLAIGAFAFCLPPIGLLMPVLFWIHYARLIHYEEASLEEGFRESFAAYAESTPRMLPNGASLKRLPLALREFRLSSEGIRHNALYALFIPGFLAAAWTGSFTVAAAIGIPGVIDWAIVHTKLGVRE